MSLVAYGDSDCESDEDNFSTDETKQQSNSNIRLDMSTVGSRSLLTLPQPKSNENSKISDDCDEINEQKPVVKSKKPFISIVQEKKEQCLLFPTLPKPKAGGKVKIIIPSLNEVYTHLK